MPKVIRITSKIQGFRRAGMSHPDVPTDHPADTFTAEQLAALKAERNLVVQELELPDAAPANGDPDGGKDDKGEKSPKTGK
ncbi:hypothetical protein K9F62_10325 [Desulfovibrio sp. JY]|nr:hypothetical protein K9F62_10325 [Desulfovibrio sp. JY]